MQSHPSWVRGLKRFVPCCSHRKVESHPSWVRGLKQIEEEEAQEGSGVAPLVGAWIETEELINKIVDSLSHPSWVRGLKLKQCNDEQLKQSRTPRGCVD